MTQTETYPHFETHAGQKRSKSTPWLIAFFATVITAIVRWVMLDGPVIVKADDAMRLVQVYDFLGGQGWFDTMQHRLGLEGGTVMHWSRLVDLPIAALVVSGDFMFGAGRGELVAIWVWWLVPLFAGMLAVMQIAARWVEPEELTAVAIVAASAFLAVGFGPGTFDHHNVQLALCLWMMAGLTSSCGARWSMPVAAICAALMLAIGMESLPLVAFGGIWLTLAWAMGFVSSRQARAFGLSLVAAMAVLFPMLVPPSQWFSNACDAFSAFHLVMASIGGAGLAAATLFAETRLARFASTMVTGCVAGAALLFVFPHCFSDPLVGLDPLVQQFWLDGIIEAQSIVELWNAEPFSLISYFVFPAIALAVCCLALFTFKAHRAIILLFAGQIALALAVTAWQVRGYGFAMMMAIIPMAFLVVIAKRQFETYRTSTTGFRLAAVWMVSISFFWTIAGDWSQALADGASKTASFATNSDNLEQCLLPNQFAALAAEPQGVVLGGSNLGTRILRHTDHRAISGNYHRNEAGILALIEIMRSAPEDSIETIRALGITHIANCLQTPDGKLFARNAPDGLQAQLNRQQVPEWLEPIPSTVDTHMVVYRVLH